MSLPPDIAHYTVPGGIKLVVDTGAGEVDLGNILGVELNASEEVLEHFSNRSGRRRRDHMIPLEDKLGINFRFDEPVFDNLIRFFKGGNTQVVGAGTQAVSDQKLTLNQEQFVSIPLSYGLANFVLRQFLDHCLRYDGSAYVDHSIEVDTPAGSPFSLLADTDEVVYLGKVTKFEEVYLDLATLGSYTGVSWKYWNGAAWTALANVAGAGLALDADGKVNWDLPADWVQKEVNGITAYWVQITATAVTTAATCNAVRQNAVHFTDYVLDPGTVIPLAPARLKRIASGFLSATEEVKVSFDKTTWTSRRFSIAKSAYQQGAARLEVYPEAGRGEQFQIVIPKMLLKPNGAISLDDTKWLETPMTLEVLDNYTVTPDYPYGYIEYLN